MSLYSSIHISYDIWLQSTHAANNKQTSPLNARVRIQDVSIERYRERQDEYMYTIITTSMSLQRALSHWSLMPMGQQVHETPKQMSFLRLLSIVRLQRWQDRQNPVWIGSERIGVSWATEDENIDRSHSPSVSHMPQAAKQKAKECSQSSVGKPTEISMPVCQRVREDRDNLATTKHAKMISNNIGNMDSNPPTSSRARAC